MASALLFLACFCLTFAVNLAAQCDLYPGEVEFEYEEITNQKEWYGKYKGFGKGLKKGFGNIYPQQQQIQQQFYPQQQQIPIFNNINSNNNMNNINNAIPEPEPTTTTEAPEEKPLPIWKLKLPRNTISAKVGIIREGEHENQFVLGKEEFDHVNLTTYKSNIKTVDVTDNDIQADQWYLICLSLAVLNTQTPSQTSCDHCTLVKSCKSSYSCGDLTSFSIDRNSFTRTKGRLVYMTYDLPTNNGTLVTRLIYEPRDQRCAPNKPDVLKPQFVIRSPVMPNTVTIVPLDGLKGNMKYRIENDLIINVKGLKNEVLLSNYHRTSKDIDRCDYEKEYLKTINLFDIQ